ncbi:hypothetical protein IV52_GL000971 [Fructilactobacillus lindneri DSM 20690 = JCM 11027]|uniref:Uncharacterized protein n=2 Tax=Fructilactobacillus lindneri TaxID=53444 RepID=A0A0R2JS63_9LACO|nr:hypothetical protein IV52_GL000971 [Fructilactobacillus lindneri DSM 20690 = JCM 11027]
MEWMEEIMKNQDPDSRYQRYDFNVDGQKRRTRKKALIWPWILGMVIIVLALAFGIRHEINKHTSSKANKPTTAKVASSQKSTTNKDSKSEHKKSKPAATKNSNETNSNKMESKSIDSKSATSSNSIQNNTNTVTTAPKSTAKTSSQTTDSGFSQSRTFNSVEDAKNWAKTTQSQWLAAGYNNYTITQNGQGFYVLTFVK